MWFQEYKEVAVLNWISFMVLLYTIDTVLYLSSDTRWVSSGKVWLKRPLNSMMYDSMIMYLSRMVSCLNI